MVSVEPKIPQTYIKQYQTLLEKARKFNDTEIDHNQDPEEVFVRQSAQVLFSEATVTLKANLKDESVKASYEVENPSNLPNSSIAFRRQGDLLWVEECALPEQYSEGKQCNFSLNLRTQEIANESSLVLPRTQPAADPSKDFESELSSLGHMLQPNGWLVGKAWQKG